MFTLSDTSVLLTHRSATEPWADTQVRPYFYKKLENLGFRLKTFSEKNHGALPHGFCDLSHQKP